MAFEVDGRPFAIAAGETIHTENSHKYGPNGARQLLRAGGWTPIAEWSDPQDWFALILAEAQPFADRALTAYHAVDSGRTDMTTVGVIGAGQMGGGDRAGLRAGGACGAAIGSRSRACRGGQGEDRQGRSPGSSTRRRSAPRRATPRSPLSRGRRCRRDGAVRAGDRGRHRARGDQARDLRRGGQGAGREAILASNTSSIPITRLAHAAPDPARFVGVHFFNPVR